MELFVVINEQGPHWDPAKPMQEQAGWPEHAAFMNALVDDRTVVLGGPLRRGSKHRAMLILRAADEVALRARLADDPWMRSGVLRLGEMLPWELLLGELPSPGAPAGTLTQTLRKRPRRSSRSVRSRGVRAPRVPIERSWSTAE